MVKIIDKSELAHMHVDLTPAVPYLEACDALDHLADTIEYELWLDHHDLNTELISPIEDAMDKIREQLPHIYPAAIVFVLRYLTNRYDK